MSRFWKNQGTLYGKGAIDAVIKVVTKEPENEWHGSFGAEYHFKGYDIYAYCNNHHR
ncbi:MAG: hypothetical protein MI799_20695 [Desulfobacterales bacterium]|nr:hypothetical protein [Desulfobacterales bacterium]